MTKTKNAEDSALRQQHWDRVYQRLTPSGVSWYEPEPSRSLELIEELHLPRDSRVIDVGGGASTLVDGLVGRGFTDVTVLDVSATALRESAGRVGGGKATWVHADLLDWTPDASYRLWHDRAVYHFLTEEGDRRRYAALLDRAVAEGGWAIVATFAPNGPERCSGLPVARYGPEELAASLGGRLELVRSEREDHVTPGGVVQPFTWVVLRKAGAAG